LIKAAKPASRIKPQDRGLRRASLIVEELMRIFTLFVRDDRYTVPTMSFVTVTDLENAAAIAESRLYESAHHLGVEVLEDDVPMAAFGRDGAYWIRESAAAS
jgi:hypothetical protein